jgi:hypothetical protein
MHAYHYIAIVKFANRCAVGIDAAYIFLPMDAPANSFFTNVTLEETDAVIIFRTIALLARRVPLWVRKSRSKADKWCDQVDLRSATNVLDEASDAVLFDAASRCSKGAGINA